MNVLIICIIALSLSLSLSLLQLLNSQSRFVRYDMVTEIVSFAQIYQLPFWLWFPGIFLCSTYVRTNVHTLIFNFLVLFLIPFNSSLLRNRKGVLRREIVFSFYSPTCWCVQLLDGRAVALSEVPCSTWTLSSRMLSSTRSGGMSPSLRSPLHRFKVWKLMMICTTEWERECVCEA